MSVLGRAPWSVPYLLPTTAASERFADFPYALYGGSELIDVCAARPAEVFATWANPCSNDSPEHFTSHSYTPLGRRTDHPVAWRRGRLGGLAFDAGTAFLRDGYWAQVALFGLVLDAVLPERLIRSSAPDLIDIALTRLPDDHDHHTVVHLTPACAERSWGRRPVAWIDGISLADVEVSLALDRPVTAAQLAHTDGQRRGPSRRGSRGGATRSSQRA